ncbi:MFS transporter [Caenimonas koreensis DSM 17982]|uniref:MFS transporter n=1 Tax=Caenimonas koreensis DSM 17982 TaxID=1121255 RepID=A0A844B671_9BURK|nr:MFS transporter [Caenimonas koreensis]MRD47149.1 MFS transporter [Caenimonas koreensis DSM 17982]
MRRINPALIVVLAGVSAALHVGKLPTAIPVLREALGVTLLEAGFLLSLVQLAGMSLGLLVGLAADALGAKRTMVAGLAILSFASALGSGAHDAQTLMLLRAVEGFGFLLASMPAPSLIRRLVEASRVPLWLGLWGAYMPFGTALALLCGPVAIASLGWPLWWDMLAALSAIMGAWLWLAIPADEPLAHSSQSHGAQGWLHRLRRTLSLPGPWLIALCFAFYSSQWLAVIGFLPSIYAQSGLAAGLAGAATALAAAVNIAGNVTAGRLLHRGVRPHWLLYCGFLAMGAGGVLAFAPLAGDAATVAAIRFAGVLMFSMVGGLIPGTLFSLAVRVSPDDRSISTTLGWMHQCSAFGQFMGPPAVAWVATRMGGWSWSWLVTGACASAGLLVAAMIGRLLRQSRYVESHAASTGESS